MRVFISYFGHLYDAIRSCTTPSVGLGSQSAGSSYLVRASLFVFSFH